MPSEKKQSEKRSRDKPILIFDCHAIGHSCKHSYGLLSYDGRPTGIIYGFLTQILTLSKKHDTTDFVFAWDSGKSLRKLFFPDYKKRRSEMTPEEVEDHKIAIKQFQLLRSDILPYLKFKNNFLQTGYEADDIIASIVKNYDKNFIVASDDKDLYQLLDRCKMWKLKKKQIYTKMDLREEWGCNPSEWAEMKKYAGCKGDSVPNIPGIAELSALKYLNGSLTGKKLQDIRETDKSILERNGKLTCLPYEGINNFELSLRTNFDISDFLDIFDRYGLYSFLKGNRLKDWKDFVNG